LLFVRGVSFSIGCDCDDSAALTGTTTVSFIRSR
jgi:hypothetical protein